MFIWLEIKKFHYLLILTGGSFPSSDLKQESLSFCDILGTCEVWQIYTDHTLRNGISPESSP